MTISFDDLRRRLDNIRNLPTLPVVYAKVQGIIRDTSSSARDVGAVVAEDPALTARLLKMVNSAFYGLGREVTTIDHAVVVLGLRELEHVILATTVLKIFPNRGTKSGFDITEFWKHALGTAILARELSRRLEVGDAEELFTMGLLHDIGKMVLALFFEDEYEEVLQAVATRTEVIGTIEEELLGFHHAEVGAIIAAKWDLPPRLVDVIHYHHKPRESETCQAEAAVINLADMICRAKNWGNPGDPYIPALADGTRELVPFEPMRVEPLMRLVERHYQDATTVFDLG